MKEEKSSSEFQSHEVETIFDVLALIGLLLMHSVQSRENTAVCCSDVEPLAQELKFSRQRLFNALSEYYRPLEELTIEQAVEFMKNQPPGLECWELSAIRGDSLIRTTPKAFVESGHANGVGSLVIPCREPKWIYYWPEDYKWNGCLLRIGGHY
ncbi:MAG: hypothetical protein JNM34_10305 [Chthonomonadaceae bacterium]|nr:hypothetical protein [Chthonomonadaceae bacterium]